MDHGQGNSPSITPDGPKPTTRGIVRTIQNTINQIMTRVHTSEYPKKITKKSSTFLQQKSLHIPGLAIHAANFSDAVLIHAMIAAKASESGCPLGLDSTQVPICDTTAISVRSCNNVCGKSRELLGGIHEYSSSTHVCLILVASINRGFTFYLFCNFPTA